MGNGGGLWGGCGRWGLPDAVLDEWWVVADDVILPDQQISASFPSPLASLHPVSFDKLRTSGSSLIRVNARILSLINLARLAQPKPHYVPGGRRNTLPLVRGRVGEGVKLQDVGWFRKEAYSIGAECICKICNLRNGVQR